MPRKKKSTSEPSVFAVNLKNLMTQKRISLKQLSDMTGISSPTLSGWLNNVTPASFEALLNVSRVLQVDYQWLLTGVAATQAAAPSLISTLKLEDAFDVEARPSIEGLYIVEARRIIPKK